MAEIKQKIERTLARLADGSDLDRAAKALFDAMGYKSDKGGKSYDAAEYFAAFPDQSGHAEQREGMRARFCESVNRVYAVSQISRDEIKRGVVKQGVLIRDNVFNAQDNESFVFLAVELNGGGYRRGDYAEMSRLLNRHLPMPLIVLFRAGNEITLTFTESRPHKRDNDREVLGKVSLLRGIIVKSPHRAHVEILSDLSIGEVFAAMNLNQQTADFKNLLVGWKRTLNTDVLSDKFHTELYGWYARVINNKVVKLPDPKNPKNGESIMSRERQILLLITRLLFIWFMKEKELVVDELFNSAQVRKLLKDGDGNYYRAILQNLFFATLNTEIDKREWSERENKTHRNFGLYRYADLIQNQAGVFALMKQTPFVNGGLFDCLDSEEGELADGYRLDCFTDNPTQRKRLHIPDSLFFGDGGLFDLFNRYKFTLEESTPVEEDVALDPELLGKVFENLLVTMERKETGSYYTPRTVVDYMVNSAITEHLARHCVPHDGDTKLWREKLDYLLDYARTYDDAEMFFNETEKRNLIHAISKIKVLDPAVGSGAFPMGVLQKLTLVLTRLDKGGKRWRKQQRNRAIRETKKAFDGGDKETRRQRLLDINDTFNRYGSSAFGAKLYLVQNSIYGVDIQPVACQIAKLRFFISLLIEQEVNDKAADNYGVKPLPNLETRFIAADSLMPLNRGLATLKSYEVINKRRELEENREKYFNAHTRAEKLKCREEDKKLRDELAHVLEKDGMPDDSAEKLAAWDMYDNNENTDWFDSTLMFGVSNDFDVVIGNPPYLDGRKISKKYLVLMRKMYDSAKGKINLFNIFQEHSFSIVKKYGIVLFIIPRTFLNNTRYWAIREFLLKKTKILYINTFDGMQFQNAVVESIIISFQKSQEHCDKLLVTNNLNYINPRIFNQAAFLNQDTYRINILGSEVERKIIEKVNNSDVKKLCNMCDVKDDISTGFKPFPEFLLGYKEGECFVSLSGSKEKFTSNLHKKVIDGKEFNKYTSIEWGGRYIKYEKRIEKNPCPPKGRSFNCQLRKKVIFDTKPKIISRQTSDRLIMTLDTSCYYTRNTIHNILPLKNSGLDIKYILSLLNSELLNFIYIHSSQETAIVHPQVHISDLKNLPIMVIPYEKQRVFIDLVDEIFDITNKDKKYLENREKRVQVELLENNINSEIYKLYGLTKKEIALVKESANYYKKDKKRK